MFNLVLLTPPVKASLISYRLVVQAMLMDLSLIVLVRSRLLRLFKLGHSSLRLLSGPKACILLSYGSQLAWNAFSVSTSEIMSLYYD